MKATERSDKLPRHVTVRLMKMCEDCSVAELELDVDESLLSDSNIFFEKYTVNTIRCKNEHLCRNLIEQNKELYEQWSDLKGENT